MELYLSLIKGWRKKLSQTYYEYSSMGEELETKIQI